MIPLASRTCARASIAVAIVNFNTRQHLHACLASVRSQPPGRVVVVDNASSDGSAEMVRTEYPDVELIGNESNRGYGAAANQAIRACTEPYVLLLNADTVLQPGALVELGRYLDLHSRVAIVGPRLENPDGTLQPSAFAFPRPVTLRPILRLVPFIRDRYLPTWSHSRPRVVAYVLGATVAIRRSAFEEVGGFDPAFFLFFEEVDLCHRLQRAGWETHFAPVTTVVHTGGASTAQEPAVSRRERAAAERRFYERRYSGNRLTAVLALQDLVAAARNARGRLRLARTPERIEEHG